MEAIRDRILYIYLNACFYAVEEKQRLELRGKDFAVGGKTDGRGVASFRSYAARRDSI